MSITIEKITFTDNNEMREAVKIFTGNDDLAKQQIVNKYGDISKWDVGNVTDMNKMFNNCSNFNSDISKWDVGNVTDMDCMFYGCSNFNTDISKWNVSNVTNMEFMFCRCNNFNSDISKWDVRNVTNMNAMFSECSNFNSDISKWNVGNVTNMQSMFENCPKFINSINGYRWNKQYWKIVNAMVKTRAIAFYWLEQSSISSYAPNGAGRKRDIEAFIEWNC